MLRDHFNPSGYPTPRLNSKRQTTLDRLRGVLRSWLAVEIDAPAMTAADDVNEAPATDRDWPSLEVVYKEVQDSVAAQNDRLKTIDTKANFGLAAATLLTAGVTGLGRALGESGRQLVASSWKVFGIELQVNQLVDWVTIISLGIYAFIAFSTFMAYRLRTFKESPQPQPLIDKYIYEEPIFTKAAITKARVRDYGINQETIEAKAVWVSLAMMLLVVEALLLVAIAVIQVTWL